MRPTWDGPGREPGRVPVQPMQPSADLPGPSNQEPTGQAPDHAVSPVYTPRVLTPGQRRAILSISEGGGEEREKEGRFSRLLAALVVTFIWIAVGMAWAIKLVSKLMTGGH